MKIIREVCDQDDGLALARPEQFEVHQGGNGIARARAVKETVDCFTVSTQPLLSVRNRNK